MTTTKKKNNRFEIIFISVSIFLFLLLIFSIALLKNSLYSAKDNVALEMIEEYEKEMVTESIDPFVGVKNINNLNSPLDNNDDPSLGLKNAKIKIFYFSDFSCSFCLDQVDIIKKIYDRFKGDVRIIWKDYPDISSLESFSYQASKAARCAHQQGNFWDYSQLLYGQEDNFSRLNKDLFLNLAKNLNLNLEIFSECLNSAKVQNSIFSNILEAEKLNILGIPYIFVNDQDILGGVSEEDLENLIELELEK